MCFPLPLFSITDRAQNLFLAFQTGWLTQFAKGESKPINKFRGRWKRRLRKHTSYILKNETKIHIRKELTITINWMLVSFHSSRTRRANSCRITKNKGYNLNFSANFFHSGPTNILWFFFLWAKERKGKYYMAILAKPLKIHHPFLPFEITSNDGKSLCHEREKREKRAWSKKKSLLNFPLQSSVFWGWRRASFEQGRPAPTFCVDILMEWLEDRRSTEDTSTQPYRKVIAP